MTKYLIPDKKDYQPYVDHYKKAMKEGKEANLFLGTNPNDRIRLRNSYEVDTTDITALMRYCLFPIYLEGNTDIAQHTFDILKSFASSTNLLKLSKFADYIFTQYRIFGDYDIPFTIDTKKLVPLYIDSLEKLTEEQKNEFLYSSLCKTLDVVPDFREVDKERVDRIVEEYKHWKQLHPRKTIKREDYHPVKLDTEVIDGAEVEDKTLKLYLLDENYWDDYIEGRHIEKLQRKFNTYLEFIENKDYLQVSKEKFKRIHIYAGFRHTPSKKGIAFLKEVQQKLAKKKIEFEIIYDE